MNSYTRKAMGDQLAPCIEQGENHHHFRETCLEVPQLVLLRGCFGLCSRLFRRRTCLLVAATCAATSRWNNGAAVTSSALEETLRVLLRGPSRVGECRDVDWLGRESIVSAGPELRRCFGFGWASKRNDPGVEGRDKDTLSTSNWSLGENCADCLGFCSSKCVPDAFKTNLSVGNALLCCVELRGGLLSRRY